MGVIAGSVIVGYAGSFLAFWLLFRLLSLYPDKELLRVFATFLLVGAVSGMHYTGLHAAHFVPEDGQVTLLETPFHTTGKEMYYFTIVISIVISVLVMMLSLADLRTWLINLGTRLDKADKIINDMKPMQGSAMDKAIMKYKKSYYKNSGDMKFKAMYDDTSKPRVESYKQKHSGAHLQTPVRSRRRR
jgi:ammonia channel protein AmtB